MMVQRLFEFVLWLVGGGYLMLVVLRFFRGRVSPRDESVAGGDRTNIWQVLGPLFLVLALYLVVTRLVRI